ncbi:MAG: T9SS type A sorting domain-containing protein [Chitinophagaceae bacterium]|nr:T9SS type A sorting domain-containing protein [Chitinophagaceae bacterium]
MTCKQVTTGCCFSKSIRAGDQSSVYIRLYDQQGKVVYQTVRAVSKGTNAFQLGNLPDLPAGSYILELRCGREKITQQVLKNR